MQQPTFRLPSVVSSQDWRAEQFSQNLLHGIIDWCNWCILDIGGYQNIRRTGVSGLYGGHTSRLRAVVDPNYTNGQVWEGSRSDWIWETGVPYSGVAPVVASGVSVSGVFYPTVGTSGTGSHIINFPLGRVVFNTAINLNSVVSTDYAYRAVSFVQSKTPWFTELLYNSFKISRSDFLSSSGGYSHLAQARRQMPAVGVELVNRRKSIPYELGSLTQYLVQDMLFYIVAETDSDRDQLIDILTGQADKTLFLPDRARIKKDARYPLSLKYDGSPVSSPMIYPDIIKQFAGISVNIRDTSAQVLDTINSWLYRGVVRITFGAIV